MFSVTISGTADHGTERRFLEAAVALVEQFGQHIDTATATSEFHADVDLAEGLTVVLDAPPDQTTPPVDTPPADVPPVETPPAPAFVTKVDGETYEQYRERLVTYNASVPIEQQAPSDIDEATWTALPAS